MSILYSKNHIHYNLTDLQDKYDEYINIKNTNTKIKFEDILIILNTIKTIFNNLNYSDTELLKSDNEFMNKCEIILQFILLYERIINRKLYISSKPSELITDIYKFTLSNQVIDSISLEELNNNLIDIYTNSNYENKDIKKYMYMHQIFYYYLNSFNDIADKSFNDIADKSFNDIADNSFNDIADNSFNDIADNSFNDIADKSFNDIADNSFNDIADNSFNDILDNFMINFEITELFNVILLLDSKITNKNITYYHFIFWILHYIFNYMNHVNKINKLTPTKIDNIISEFKIIFNKVKLELTNLNLTEANINLIKFIKKIEDNINLGKKRNEDLQGFNESYHDQFNNMIPIKTSNDFNNTSKPLLTITGEYKKNSASKSRIYIGFYNDKPCYMKIFKSSRGSNKNLLYEQKIYRYLQTRNKDLKDYYEDNFVKVYDVFKITRSNIKNLIHKDQIGKKRSYSSLLDYSYGYYYVIVTEDIGGFTYKEFLNKNYKYKPDINIDINIETKSIITTLFDVIYGIYIMNDKLKIFHNDTHFRNILIKKLDEPIKKKYQIGKIEVFREINYRICFYDFDLAYLTDEPNPMLIDITSPKNTESAIDIWRIAWNLYDQFIFSRINVYIELFIREVFFDNKLKLINNKYHYDTINLKGLNC